MICFAELFADYATASRANVRNSREGSGCSSRQVMLTGRLPLCLRNRIKRLEVLEVFVIVCNDGDEALTQARGPGRGRKPVYGFNASLTNLATGRWFSVMTTSSPGANWWINSFSLVWASSAAVNCEMEH
jgi:hypothetical protein